MKNKILNPLRRAILIAVHQSREGHIPSALSILDIVWVLYDGILRINSTSVSDPNRDFFILSKGQASLALYTVLAEKGFITHEDVQHYCNIDGILGGHPDRTKVPGVEVSTGSLGHGFPMAVGIALGNRLAKRTNRTFALIGDGEANEGTVWEAALLGAHHKLSNLTLIIDHNHSTDRALMVDDLAQKFNSFGWCVLETNGHDHAQLETALTTTDPIKPMAIVAHTIKGHGIPEMENNWSWHHKAPTDDELSVFLKELK